MSQQDQTSPEQIPGAEETLIEFPCDFPIKVMGETHDDFITEVTRVIQGHLPEFASHLIEIRGSSNGKYLSLTCLVYVISKPQLDDIYRSLTSHPMVKVVL
jgi:putative lipoic acid-binding regulatory protein